VSDLVILHTNDMHHRLREEKAERLQHIAEQERARSVCLLLDAGDAVGAGNVTFHPAGEPILERMSAIGYDAMTVGNREFHFTEIGFHAKLSRARFPVLCANVRPRGEASLPVQPYLILTVGGVHVGIIGLTVPMITERMLSQHVSAYVFGDPVRRGCELAEELRPQVDLLIALTHIGLKRDIELARATDRFALIIGGHSHSVLEQPLREGKTAIVQAGSYARYVGRVCVELDDPVNIEGDLLALT